LTNASLPCTPHALRSSRTLKGIGLSRFESGQTFFKNLVRVGGLGKAASYRNATPPETTLSNVLLDSSEERAALGSISHDICKKKVLLAY